MAGGFHLVRRIFRYRQFQSEQKTSKNVNQVKTLYTHVRVHTRGIPFTSTICGK